LKPHEWVAEVTLANEWVRLEPLREEHAAELQRARDRETFRFFVTQQPPTDDESGMATFVRSVLAMANVRPFVVVSGCEVVGMTTLMDIRPEAKGLEIGMTWYAAAAQGTAVNPAAKQLLLAHAFESLGCLRVQLKCDANNARSRAAILKLGAQFEGILRRHGIRRDGSIRDTAMFSIVAEEWPDVRRRLEDRLHRFDVG
jgi:N-acetyltransferase